MVTDSQNSTTTVHADEVLLLRNTPLLLSLFYALISLTIRKSEIIFQKHAIRLPKYPHSPTTCIFSSFLREESEYRHKGSVAMLKAPSEKLDTSYFISTETMKKR